MAVDNRRMNETMTNLNVPDMVPIAYKQQALRLWTRNG